MNDEWGTPDELFDKLNGEFHFKFDLCANKSNSKCGTAWSDDVVTVQSVQSSLWMNPPYSRGNIDICMEKAVDLVHQDNIVVCLVRFDPSTKWFQRYVDGVASEVRMLDRRVKFMGAPSAYNFPCCVVVYDPDHLDLDAPTSYNIWGW